LALKKALDNMPKVTYHEVKRIEVSVEQQTNFILQHVAKKSMVLFSELVQGIKEKIIIIVTFVALLDLIKSRKLIVRQSELFDDIRIKLLHDNY
jgi:segregation and condensation protein A